jgi:hypothetical protein
MNFYFICHGHSMPEAPFMSKSEVPGPFRK